MLTFIIGVNNAVRLTDEVNSILNEFFEESVYISSMITDGGGNYRNMAEALAGALFLLLFSSVCIVFQCCLYIFY